MALSSRGAFAPSSRGGLARGILPPCSIPIRWARPPFVPPAALGVGIGSPSCFSDPTSRFSPRPSRSSRSRRGFRGSRNGALRSLVSKSGRAPSVLSSRSNRPNLTFRGSGQVTLRSAKSVLASLGSELPSPFSNLSTSRGLRGPGHVALRSMFTGSLTLLGGLGVRATRDMGGSVRLGIPPLNIQESESLAPTCPEVNWRGGA